MYILFYLPLSISLVWNSPSTNKNKLKAIKYKTTNVFVCGGVWVCVNTIFWTSFGILQESFGGLSYRADGSKMVCLDGYLHITPGNCVVLSFGINNEWSFDDAMDRFGCHVSNSRFIAWSHDCIFGGPFFSESPFLY